MWKDILKRMRQLGKLVQIDGKYYRFPPNVINDYKQEIQNMRNDPIMRRQDQKTMIRVAKRRIVQKYNLKPVRRI